MAKKILNADLAGALSFDAAADIALFFSDWIGGSAAALHASAGQHVMDGLLETWAAPTKTFAVNASDIFNSLLSNAEKSVLGGERVGMVSHGGFCQRRL